MLSFVVVVLLLLLCICKWKGLVCYRTVPYFYPFPSSADVFYVTACIFVELCAVIDCEKEIVRERRNSGFMHGHVRDGDIQGFN